MSDHTDVLQPLLLLREIKNMITRRQLFASLAALLVAFAAPFQRKKLTHGTLVRCKYDPTFPYPKGIGRVDFASDKVALVDFPSGRWGLAFHEFDVIEIAAVRRFYENQQS